ncbi:MAG: phospholipase [Paludibacteraceae bacterium]|nr:phospholipase [Paludibacteraceae bacterium]
MLPLLLFILLVIVVVVLYEIRERQRAKSASGHSDKDSSQPSARPEGCCGEHLVCERETLLQTNAEIIYYDDEELDALADIDPKDFTPAQHAQMREVFETLREQDVPGWCRSLQLRRIQLPDDIRDEALLIVRERRNSR